MPSSLSVSLVLFFIVTNIHCFSLSFSTAYQIPSTKNQDGILAESPIAPNQNVLQKHAAFFDRNHDGIIYPAETFKGFRALGFGVMLSTVAANFINAGLSQITRPGKPRSILFPIEVKNIQLGKHGSDSGVYDTEGRFVASKFEELFSKHAKKNPNALTFDELMEMVKSNRVPKDYKGWLASYVEWKILYVLAKDKDGLLTKESVRSVYDGSLFEQKEKEHSGKKTDEITSI
ncbi:PREDICTED: probable peroxygenase 5 [Lupinus angustifolius]|uniref:probable peroxygenase 5 n=1 Tax=Lupinus angustifolius TaxID=3871 RepID=UPI00092FB4A1|nr:PREDICTED: probable peroxygenase 5 [Lupinus angustifolius]